MKRKLLKCMTTATTALLLASCTSELALEGTSSNNAIVGEEEMDVTFSISTENAQMQTRTDNDGGPGQWQNVIGKGQNIDMLIYAVYEKNDDDTFSLLKQYGKGIVNNDDQNFDNNPAIAAKKPTDVLDYDGQTIINVGDKFKNGKSENITLRLMRGKTYHIAFWAQSSNTTAFNTDNLEKVKVNYTYEEDGQTENFRNNDELRDAFCKVESFSVTPSTEPRTVILTRPMAQINVGTTGADYKNLFLGTKVFPNIAITQSQIYLDGVAQCLNVVTDEVIVSEADDEKLIQATFKYSTIPAFMNMNFSISPYDESGSEIPNLGGSLVRGNALYDGSDKKEEFLIIDLNGDRDIEGYRYRYPTLEKDGSLKTETFKYLSMCYALVPAQHKTEDATTDDNSNPNLDPNLDPYKNSVLDEVRISFKGLNHLGTEVDYTPMTLHNVPVHRNWRTNILGGLKWKKDPTDPDPEDPDDIPDDPDETTVFNLTNVCIDLDPMYYDDLNGTTGDQVEDEDGKTIEGTYWWHNGFPKAEPETDSDDQTDDDPTVDPTE